ncbi:ATP-binding protein [Virgibacillus sp. CBA3643]|uniref:ATP-binding protein n=1 Tax=Virgibacillus sp. CBA3643 TaxID=2942278 RepID=UPI0035A2D8C2
MEFENYNPIDRKNKQTSNILNQKQNGEVFPDLSTLPSNMISWIEYNKNEIITVWDQNGKVLYISKSIERLLGYNAFDLEDLVWHEKISPEDVTYIIKNFSQHTDEAQTFTINILNKQGKYIWSECTIAKMFDEENSRICYIATVKDITDKKEAEEIMIRSEKMSIAGQLAAGIAHEIRNPLTSLKGFLQLMQAGVKGNEQYYKIMLDEIEKMESITSELLFISKPLTETMKEESIEAMIRDVIVLLRAQANLQNINIEYDHTYKGFIYCDRSQIKQVLINLVKNAIESMVDGGTIKLATTSTQTQVILSIRDEGSGIPDEIIHKLGEPFFTTKQNGTGLGLMISKQILKRHDAILDIEQNSHKGSTFRIFFPLP